MGGYARGGRSRDRGVGGGGVVREQRGGVSLPGVCGFVRGVYGAGGCHCLLGEV